MRLEEAARIGLAMGRYPQRNIGLDDVLDALGKARNKLSDCALLAAWRKGFVTGVELREADKGGGR